MFKVIHNDQIVDVLDRVIYIRCLQNGKVVNTDSTCAHGFYGSTKKCIYIFEGIDCPQKSSLPTARLESITTEEYSRLKHELELHRVDDNSPELEHAKLSKIQEMSVSCRDAIVTGIEVLLTDGAIHKFKLTVEDQLNLESIRAQLSSGSSRFLYHETSTAVKWYSADDMRRIISAMDKHRFKHTTYYNLLKHCIHNMYSKDDITNIYYGIKLESLPYKVNLDVKEYNIV